MRIEALHSSKIEAYLKHLTRHMAESGRDGTPLFGPYSPNQPWEAESKRAKILERWSRELNESGWERAWVAYDGSTIIGHIDVRARELPNCTHRALIGMGVESPYRRRGLGEALLRAAVDWAKTQPRLAWLDLNVLAQNEPAIRLYRRFGFVEVGRIEDLFRVDGESLDDIQMTLKLSSGSGGPF